MKDEDALGALIEAFVNKVSHPRGRALTLVAEASLTVPQAILLNFALNNPNSTPSSLAAAMKISPPSVSQMIERLVKLAFVERIEDPADRRSKTIKVTTKARTFLKRLKAVRSAEYAAGAAGLSLATRKQLVEALAETLEELAQTR